MRAVVMRDKTLVLDTVPEPTPAPGQVVVKTLACGICGSDLHALRFADRMVDAARRSGMPALLDPGRDVVMGHEFCAEVVDRGPDGSGNLAPGTRVVSMPIAFDAGGIKTIGYSNDLPGGYGEFMVLNEMLLLPVPNGLSTEVAALTEPLAVGWHAVNKANWTKEDVPLVIGCGPVGLAVIAALKVKGAAPIIAADFSPKRRELALQLGADIVVDPGALSPYTSWAGQAVPEGCDPSSPLTLMGLGPQPRPGLIFECVGVPGILQQIVAGAPRHARVVVVGVFMESDTIEPAIGINKELNVQFVLGYTPQEFAETLGFLADGRIEAAPMITGKVGLDGIPAAFDELGHPEKHAKILAEPWR
jgi:threonine dehydrogenase-like Zn-dependent dehydrogenase